MCEEKASKDEIFSRKFVRHFESHFSSNQEKCLRNPVRDELSQEYCIL